MDHPPDAVLSTVDTGCAELHLLRLAVEHPGQRLDLDCESELVIEVGRKRLRAPARVVERPRCGRQEIADGLEADLMATDPAHQRYIWGMRPQLEVRPWVPARVMAECLVTLLNELHGLGFECWACCLHLASSSSRQRNVRFAVVDETVADLPDGRISHATVLVGRNRDGGWARSTSFQAR